MEAFLQFAAKIFNENVKNISLDTKYGVYTKWDSMMHLRLIMETEEEYGIEVPFTEITKIKTLRDLYKLIEEAKA